MRLVGHKKIVRWLDERLQHLDAYVYPRIPRGQSRLVEVLGHFPTGTDDAGSKRLPKLRTAHRSMSFGDAPLQLTENDVSHEFLVRIPWGVSGTGGFIFYAVLETLTEDQAVFRALYHVGRLDDGSRVYAWKGYRFGMNRRDVRGREVRRGDEGQVQASERRVAVTKVLHPEVP